MTSLRPCSDNFQLHRVLRASGPVPRQNGGHSSLLRLQWHKTVEVPQLPFMGARCSVRQWIHILPQQGCLLDEFLVFYVSGFSRLLRSHLVLLAPRRPRQWYAFLLVLLVMTHLALCSRLSPGLPLGALSQNGEVCTVDASAAEQFFLENQDIISMSPSYFAVFQQSADPAG